MKRNYIAPEMEIVELATEVLMFSGSLSGDEANSHLGTGRGGRGDWDDIW